MKKFIIIGSILLAVVLIMSIVAYASDASGDDKTKAKKETVAVQKADKHDCGNCSAECLEKHTTGECTGHEPGTCTEQCSGECTVECKDNCGAECKAKHATGECTGHKPGECEKKK